MERLAREILSTGSKSETAPQVTKMSKSGVRNYTGVSSEHGVEYLRDRTDPIF